MTVIAVSGREMAADGWVCRGELKEPCSFPKIFRTEENWLVGASGFASDCGLVREWFLAGKNKQQVPKFTSESEIHFLVLKPDGTLWRNTAGASGFYPVAAPYAIGSRDGSMVADVAMRLGRSAGEAVVLAAAPAFAKPRFAARLRLLVRTASAGHAWEADHKVAVKARVMGGAQRRGVASALSKAFHAHF